MAKENFERTEQIRLLLEKCNAAELQTIADNFTVYPRRAKTFANRVLETIEKSNAELKAYTSKLKKEIENGKRLRDV